MTLSRIRHLASRARRIWDEADYAQRRLFEIQTGIPATRNFRRNTRDDSMRLYRRDY